MFDYFFLDSKWWKNTFFFGGGKLFLKKLKYFYLRRFCNTVLFVSIKYGNLKKKIRKHGNKWRYLGGGDQIKSCPTFISLIYHSLCVWSKEHPLLNFLCVQWWRKWIQTSKFQVTLPSPPPHPSSLLIWHDMKVQSVSSTGELRL